MNYCHLQLSDKERINQYMLPYGEKSCQHNFAALYALSNKYHTLFCVEDDMLFIRQLAKDEPGYQSYLMPIGPGNKKKAMNKLFSEVHKTGHCLKLQTITSSAKDFLEEAFPGRFQITQEEDYSEYLYYANTLSLLKGNKLKNKRYDYLHFHKYYHDILDISPIRSCDFPMLLDFQQKWLAAHKEESTYPNLLDEDCAIRRVIDAYEELDFQGIIIRIDGNIAGYAMGCPISDSTFDVFFEKGDIAYRNIYRALATDMVKLQCSSCLYINREEDLGVSGLRLVKRAYHPDYLMPKYIAKEFPSF